MIRTPTPRENMVLRAYDAGTFESPQQMADAYGLTDYAEVLDAYRPQWRANPWRNPVRWYINRVQRHRGPESAAWASRCLRRLDSFMSGRALTPAMLDDYLRTLTSKPSTINRQITCLRTFLREIEAMGWLPEPLDRYLTILTALPVTTAPVRVLEPAELKQLMSAATALKHGNGTRIFLLASLILGSRPGETNALQGKSIIPSRMLVKIPPYKRHPERLASYKWSPVGHKLFGLLVLKRGPADLLCGDTTKGPSGWKRLLVAAGFNSELDRKVLRATARSAYSDNGAISERYLRRMFGHSTETADRHYQDDGSSPWGEGDTIDEWLGCADEMAEVFNAIARFEGRSRDQILRVQPAEPARQAACGEAEVERRIIIDCGTDSAGFAAVLHDHDGASRLGQQTQRR